jgi:hypothetical protein
MQKSTMQLSTKNTVKISTHPTTQPAMVGHRCLWQIRHNTHILEMQVKLGVDKMWNNWNWSTASVPRTHSAYSSHTFHPFRMTT